MYKNFNRIVYKISYRIKWKPLTVADAHSSVLLRLPPLTLTLLYLCLHSQAFRVEAQLWRAYYLFAAVVFVIFFFVLTRLMQLKRKSKFKLLTFAIRPICCCVFSWVINILFFKGIFISWKIYGQNVFCLSMLHHYFLTVCQVWIQIQSFGI